MKLPSVAFEDAARDGKVSKNAIIARNQKWFNHIYMDRYDEPLEKKTEKFLEIGKAYTFTYDAKHKDKLDFWNVVPFIICLGHLETKEKGTKNILGLNLNFIPPQIRMLVLDKIVKLFSTTVIDPNREKIDKYQFSAQNELPLKYKLLEKILEGSGFKFAIRSYIYTKIVVEPLIVTYNDWWRVASFPTQFLEKMTIRQIYYLYQKNLKSSYKIGQKQDLPVISNFTKKQINEYLKNQKNGG